MQFNNRPREIVNLNPNFFVILLRKFNANKYINISITKKIEDSSTDKLNFFCK